MLPYVKLEDVTPLGKDATTVKKFDGYVSVILLPIASAPPAVVVNENVAAAPARPAVRQEDSIEKEKAAT